MGARISIAGLALVSQQTLTREEAVDFRRHLEEIRSQVIAESQISARQPIDCDQLEKSLRKELCDSHQVVSKQLVLRFRATINARRWVGRTISSPQVTDLSEAMSFQRRLVHARERGWPALREEWLYCLQRDRSSSRRKALTPTCAEKLIATAEYKSA